MRGISIDVSIRNAAEYVLTNYPSAMSGDQKGSHVAAYLRHDFPAAVREVIDTKDELLVEGSAGIDSGQEVHGWQFLIP